MNDLTKLKKLANQQVKEKARIEEIRVVNDNRAIHLWINAASLSYLDITEAIDLRDELNKAIKNAAAV